MKWFWINKAVNPARILGLVFRAPGDWSVHLWDRGIASKGWIEQSIREGTWKGEQ